MKIYYYCQVDEAPLAELIKTLPLRSASPTNTAWGAGMAANRSEVKMEDKMLLLVAAEARQAWEQSRCKVAAHHKRIDTIRRVAEDPSQLEFLSPVQQEDRAIVLAALKNSRDGGELRYASTTLQRDTELRAIAREALESSFEEQVETLLTGAKALDLEIPAIVVEKVCVCVCV